MKQELVDELMQRIILKLVRDSGNRGIKENKLIRKSQKKLKKILKMLDIETEL